MMWVWSEEWGKKAEKDGSEKETQAGKVGVGNQFSAPIFTMSSAVNTNLRKKLLKDLQKLQYNQ